MKIRRLFLVAMICLQSGVSLAQMKTWWFFSYEHTTEEGMRADLKALKDAGFTGVVYYDQNHRKTDEQPTVERQPDKGFSPQWWKHLRFAAEEAKRQDLTFEINISNGYVAGGKWIDAEHAMQRVVNTETIVDGGKTVDMKLPVIKGKEGYVKTIAVLALPTADTSAMRHITVNYAPTGKGRNGAMQMPGTNRTFYGAGYKEFPPAGTLQVSDDSINWRDVIVLQPFLRSQGGYSTRTDAFPATKGNFFRINSPDASLIRSWKVGSAAKQDRWEEKVDLQCEFTEKELTPEYSKNEVVGSDEIINLTDRVVGNGHLHWEAPKGVWRIVHLAAIITGAESKHGRQSLIGYECDKLSVAAAELHWNSYTQRIIDSLKVDNLVQGVCMDSHEAGSQNWTPLFLDEFKKFRGYDLTPFLAVMAGYIVDSREKTDEVMRDIRRTISDCVRENYFGTFQRKANENGITLTAQAIGGALCIVGDAVSVKKILEKPQGEFWTYQQTGAYDIKDCSSAAHIYGKEIASAEAMTDAEYKHSPLDLKRVADIAFSMGAQEFVVCATPHIPDVNPTEPYIAGREYAINRSNPKWNDMKGVWAAAKRTMEYMQRGKAAPDVLIYMGDELPMRILTHKLPLGIDNLDWDACTGDALNYLIVKDGKLVSTLSGVEYGALLIEDDIFISKESAEKIKQFESDGLAVLKNGNSIIRPLQIDGNCEAFVHTHRTDNGTDIFFVANITTKQQTMKFSIKGSTGPTKHLRIVKTETGKIHKIKTDNEGKFILHLSPGESVIMLTPKSK